MTDLSTRRAIERPGPDEPAEVRGTSTPRPVDPPSVCVDGVELTRLLHRAQLSPAQAVELAAAVASELARRAGPEASTPDGEPVPVGPVLVGADGRVVPGPGGNAGPGMTPPGAGLAAGAQLTAIADAVRPHARHAGPAAEQLLAGVDCAVAELPEAGPGATARSLREVAGAIDRRVVRAEIGALVRAIGADAGPVGTPRTRAHPEPPRAPAASGTMPGRIRARTLRRRTGAWLLSVLVLAGVVLLEVVFLRGHILTDVRLLLNAGHGGSATTAAARTARTPDGLPVAAPAPASAGAVAGVDLRALAPCVPGAPCSVRLEVRLAEGTGQQVVRWSYRVVDRCTGTSATAHGGTVTVPAGAQHAVTVGTVALPARAGLALVAVTRQPAVAASAPLVVGSCTSHR